MGTGTTLNVDVAGAGQGSKSLARHLPTAARFLMGLMFFVFGLNGFLNFIPPPTEPMPEASMAFSIALMKTGYMMPLIKGTEVLAGVLLLANRFVPLALALLAPVIVNIVAFHLFLAPMGMVMTFVVLALELYLAWVYRDAFRPMLALRATPGSK
ncbi:DoxX family membrane protein [Pyxidicoccus xibeiensis]|uniref:DoxX family membrane protein n=1 Tax=Pyxidicoccus xibeiensis TaxID=2906759 RepID=UPI0020A752E6|nr:DoxX family membrane protein [Pyxidicoccus xibeiensis]MCP3140067.1 DoxX family membrane protein [Pyxidicoccus xibeiensis]